MSGGVLGSWGHRKGGPGPGGQGLPHWPGSCREPVSWEVAARAQQPVAPTQGDEGGEEGEEGRGRHCGPSARRVLLGSLAPRRETEKRPWAWV